MVKLIEKLSMCYHVLKITYYETEIHRFRVIVFTRKTPDRAFVDSYGQILFYSLELDRS